jgi:prepilin signal peptidase PulO-like enzyme (type II secretory pathway)
LLALAYCVLLAGFIVATFIDFEHFIIPDEITIGGMVAGFLFRPSSQSCTLIGQRELLRRRRP